MATVETIAAGAAIPNPLKAAIHASGEKLKVVLIGTGVRGNGFWERGWLTNTMIFLNL